MMSCFSPFASPYKVWAQWRALYVGSKIKAKSDNKFVLLQSEGSDQSQ